MSDPAKTLPHRIVIDESQFAQLVRGKPIELMAYGEARPIAEVALADIGWDRMYFHIESALREMGDGDI